jgi:hypothetical protein
VICESAKGGSKKRYPVTVGTKMDIIQLFFNMFVTDTWEVGFTNNPLESNSTVSTEVTLLPFLKTYCLHLHGRRVIYVLLP